MNKSDTQKLIEKSELLGTIAGLQKARNEAKKYVELLDDMIWNRLNQIKEPTK